MRYITCSRARGLCHAQSRRVTQNSRRTSALRTPMCHDTGQLDQIAPFQGHLSPETRAIKQAANASDAFEISDRAVDGLQNPRVVSQDIAARPQGREIQAHRALVVVIDLHDLIMPKKPALLLEPP